MSSTEPLFRFLIFGGPGAGKTTTLHEAAANGLRTMPDVAREVIRERIASGLPPRPDPEEFARILVARDRSQHQAAEPGGPVLFERGLPDSLGMLAACGLMTRREVAEDLSAWPYNPLAFFFPPWQEIYTPDSERDQTWPEAERIGGLAVEWYLSLGFEVVTVPIGTPAERMDFILMRIRHVLGSID